MVEVWDGTVYKSHLVSAAAAAAARRAVQIGESAKHPSFVYCVYFIWFNYFILFYQRRSLKDSHWHQK